MKNSLTKQEYSLEDVERINRFRELIIDFEEQLINLPGSYGDPKTAGQSKDVNAVNPLKHTFADGLYIREIFMPKGQVITTGIHKQEHPYFVLKGDVSVLTEDGVIRIKAPHQGITKPGTKRLIYIHEDTTWITVHATEKDNIEEVLEDILAKDFNDPDINLKALQQKLQLKNK
tara:strand:- start:2852 stop:3373 length:522 start_codon:yes stop_codon:yes gene_type:complete